MTAPAVFRGPPSAVPAAAMADHHLARILIVDDQPSNLHLLERTLRRGGYLDVSSTTDPRAVAGLHRRDPYDLIVLDLQMPEMNGFEVMARLYDLPGPQPAVLVMSAASAHMAAAFEAGASGYLGKPFFLPDVVARVELVLATAFAGDEPVSGPEERPSA